MQREDRVQLIREAATLVAQTETPSLDAGLLEHCARQHRFAAAVFPRRGPLSSGEPYAGHYYRANEASTSYLNVQGAYKSTLFYSMNKLIYQRAVHPEADRNPACYDGAGCQMLLDQTYVFLQGILDLPRYGKEFTVYRLLSREIGASGYATRPEEFVRRYYSPGTVYPNYKFLSTGLLVGDALDGQVGLQITVPADFPALFYYPQCWSRQSGSATQSGSAIMEGSEVLLPYTTDPSGESLTWGLKIEQVDTNKVYGSSSDGKKQWKAKILIRCRVVPLQKPIALQKVEKSSIFGLYDENFKYMHEKDIFGNERLQTLQQIYERKVPVQTLQRFGIGQQTIQVLVANGYDDFEAVSMLEKDEIDEYARSDQERKLLHGYVHLFQFLDKN